MKQTEIIENLRDAGCEEIQIQSIITSLNTGDTKKAQKQIELCRKNILDQLHHSQKCIDRLDYLQYRMETE